ncbi:hypothetical protein DWB85_17315 [Seongchinamella sediminis]|uniref:DUF4412 domain-containing protein n=1 Tax=Seongchinamella sediminis TaxID=2283635 RepID=A0A3L7DVE9_9GAMM|nr:hypothetical protein [Seongchinamella sediminis]RLQ20509.1 hypothetical protein DWB85_17315 [Seongchinamella sediminis]
MKYMESDKPTRGISLPGRMATFALLLLGLTVNGPAWASHPYQKWADELGIDLNVSYDGTRVMEFEGGTIEATERRAPGKMYTETHVQGMSSAVILREDLGKSYLVMNSLGFYKEDTLEGGMLQAANGMEFSRIEKMGREPILGFPSTKYQTRFKDNDGKGAGFIWVTDDGIPIKLDMIYSNRDAKGMRIGMEFTELNIRPQDPSVFELPAGLKPMSLGGFGSMMKLPGSAPAANTQAAPATAGNSGASSAQEACLKEAAAKAAAQRDAQEKKNSFGRLMGAVARTASRFGVGSDIQEITRGLYDANATADDVQVVADELGISTDDVERCREAN